MTLQDVSINVKNKSTGIGRSNSRKTVAVVGVCSSGTAETVYAHTSKTKLVSDLVGGPAPEASASILDEAGGTVLTVPVTASVAGSFTTVTTGGTTPPALTPSGTPKDAIKCKILVVTPGALGTAVIKISRDGGVTYDAPVTTAASIVDYKGTGVTLGFAAGSFAANNTYEFESIAPYYSTVNLSAAFAALLADARRWKLVYVVGQAAGATDTIRCDAQAAMAAAVSSQMTSAATAKRWSRALMDAPRPVADTSAGETAWQTALKASSAFGNYQSDRLFIAAGDVDQLSPISSLIVRRPLGFEVASRIAKVALSVDISAVDEAESGPLPARVRDIYHDERVSPGLDDARFITVRTFPGADALGFYFTDSPTMAQSDSDYARIPACLVVDEASHVAYAAMLKFLSKRTEVDAATGFIAEHEAKSAEQVVGAKLRAGIVQTKDATGATIEVARDDDLRTAPPTLNFKLNLNSWVYPKAVSVDIGVITPSLAFAA